MTHTILFVYGTLRRDCHAHDLLSDWKAPFLGEVKTGSLYRLYDVGDFPGLSPSDTPGPGVHGELFEVPEYAFQDLDTYECVSSGLFRRAWIDLADGRQAMAYLYNRPFDPKKEVREGLWPKD